MCALQSKIDVGKYMKTAMSVTFKENVIVFQGKQAEHDIESCFASSSGLFFFALGFYKKNVPPADSMSIRICIPNQTNDTG